MLIKAFDNNLPSRRNCTSPKPHSPSVWECACLHTLLEAENWAAFCDVVGALMLFSFFFSLSPYASLLWVPEKIFSLYDCGLSREGVLALGRKGLFPLSCDHLSIHLSIHLSTHQTIYTQLLCSAGYCVWCQGFWDEWDSQGQHPPHLSLLYQE